MLDLSIYKSSPPTLHPNLLKVPVTSFSFTSEGCKEFNTIYREMLNHPFPLKLTESGGLCTRAEFTRGGSYRWYLRDGKYAGELIVRDPDCRWYRFQIGRVKLPGKRGNVYIEEGEEKQVFGRISLFKVRRKCKDLGLDLDSLSVSKKDGLSIKNTIPAPLIRIERPYYIDRIFENSHHIDYNSSYAYGICEDYPELMPVMKYFFDQRKKRPEFKKVLSVFHGVCQSAVCQYKFSNLAYSANMNNRIRVEDLAARVAASGRRIIAFNTDGFWYDGEIYHDENEGHEFGQWKNDHVNCRIRFKSKGCYEYIEKGIYCPVYRGKSSYEDKVPREGWIWGDIYKGNPEKYTFKEGIGYTRIIYTHDEYDDKFKTEDI